MTKDCLGVGGGGIAPALTARKFGIMPKMRLGCCLDSATDWLAASEAAAIELVDLADEGLCSCVDWTGAGGADCCAFCDVGDCAEESVVLV